MLIDSTLQCCHTSRGNAFGDALRYELDAERLGLHSTLERHCH